MHRPLVSSLVAAGLLAPAIGLAAEPDVAVLQGEDNVVIGRMLLPQIEADVRNAVVEVIAMEEDAVANVLDVETAADGSCERIIRTTKGVWSPLVMQTRRCPTGSGWTEFLVDSEDFSAYETNWILKPGPQGTHVELRVRTEINKALIPQRMVNNAGLKTVRSTLMDVVRQIANKRKSE